MDARASLNAQEQYEAEVQQRARIIKETCSSVPEEWRAPAELFLALMLRLVEATEGPQMMSSLLKQPRTPEETGTDPEDDGPWMYERTNRHAQAWNG